LNLVSDDAGEGVIGVVSVCDFRTSGFGNLEESELFGENAEFEAFEEESGKGMRDCEDDW
jgi:hypothetical protein